MQRSVFSGSHASIGRMARGPAPGCVASRGRPKIRRASDSMVAAAGAGERSGAAASASGAAARSLFSSVSTPLAGAASGGALGSGSGAVRGTGGGRGGGGGLTAGGGGACSGGGGTYIMSTRRDWSGALSWSRPASTSAGCRDNAAATRSIEMCTAALTASGLQARLGEFTVQDNRGIRSPGRETWT